MECNPAELPFLSNIGFMLTYKCTVACPHCVVEAGPHRKEEMLLEHAFEWIEQARAYRDGHIQGLALTGGEPFYNLENLGRISQSGKQHGFIVSVVTNAFWAATRDGALKVLRQVPAIQMLSFSTDVYHQKRIPFDHIRNAIWAARELGRLYNVAVCTDSKEDAGFLKIMEDLKTIGEGDNVRLAITAPVGRARKHTHQFNYRVETAPAASACNMASSPVVFPDGRVIACIGPVLTLPSRHPMYLGNLNEESLAEILDRAELNPLLHTIRVWGPHRLVACLKQNGMESLLPKEYIADCVCDVCFKLLSDGPIVAALNEILQDEESRHTLAYARVYYLNETRMAQLYHLGVVTSAIQPSG